LLAVVRAMKSSTRLIKSETKSGSNNPWLPEEFSRNTIQDDPENNRTGDKADQPTRADILIQKAHTQVDAISREAYEQGLHAAEEEMQSAFAAMQSILEEIEAWRIDLLKSSEAEVIGLVLTISKSLFGQGFRLAEDDLAGLFNNVLEYAKPLGNLRLHANPEDVEMLPQNWAQTQSTRQGANIQLIPDVNILAGGCTIESDNGMVDARIESKIDAAVEALVTALENRVGEIAP
jgi:flagellar assembly protein FliH